MKITTYVQLLFFITTVFFPSVIRGTSAQLSSLSNPPNVNQEFVTYQKHSNFIHEFNLPASVDKHGLKGITTDSQGNPWFYDQTNKLSMIMKYTLANDTFNSYSIDGKTVTDNPVINLAGGLHLF